MFPTSTGTLTKWCCFRQRGVLISSIRVMLQCYQRGVPTSSGWDMLNCCYRGAPACLFPYIFPMWTIICDIGTKGPSLLLLLALIDPFCVILSIHCLIWLSLIINWVVSSSPCHSSLLPYLVDVVRIVLYRVHLLRLCMLCGIGLYGTFAYYFFYFVRSRMY